MLRWKDFPIIHFKTLDEIVYNILWLDLFFHLNVFFYKIIS